MADCADIAEEARAQLEALPRTPYVLPAGVPGDLRGRNAGAMRSRFPVAAGITGGNCSQVSASTP